MYESRIFCSWLTGWIGFRKLLGNAFSRFRQCEKTEPTRDGLEVEKNV